VLWGIAQEQRRRNTRTQTTPVASEQDTVDRRGPGYRGMRCAASQVPDQKFGRLKKQICIDKQ